MGVIYTLFGSIYFGWKKGSAKDCLFLGLYIYFSVLKRAEKIVI